jgi:diketogulonate reductase-like aldo/keto reductase
MDIYFHATDTANDARSLKDGVKLSTSSSEVPVVLPWVGYGTYKLAKDVAQQSVLEALKIGYRCIDTAFIYGGETMERNVGKAIQAALEERVLKSRQEIFVVTKHWRKYHGYNETLECLRLSLSRLQLDYVDLYLMHWPGPAWKTMNRRKDVIESEGPWFYASDNCKSPDQMAHVRSETWRAMEDALKEGKVKSIGVSNFTVEHLIELKRTAKIWPPAVNQVECHPLYPQTELVEYCKKEGIVLQAYASLGGQDTGKKKWKELGLEGDREGTDEEGSAAPDQETSTKQRKGKQKKQKSDTVVSLLSCRPVVSLAQDLNRTPAQVLLRWALSQNFAVIPKATSTDRMKENAEVLDFTLTPKQVSEITEQIQAAVARTIKGKSSNSENGDPKTSDEAAALGRLCWRNDPLRLLDFK